MAKSTRRAKGRRDLQRQLDSGERKEGVCTQKRQHSVQGTKSLRGKAFKVSQPAAGCYLPDTGLTAENAVPGPVPDSHSQDKTHERRVRGRPISPLQVAIHNGRNECAVPYLPGGQFHSGRQRTGFAPSERAFQPSYASRRPNSRCLGGCRPGACLSGPPRSGPPRSGSHGPLSTSAGRRRAGWPC